MDRYELRCLVCDWIWTSDYSQEDCPHCGAEDVYAEEWHRQYHTEQRQAKIGFNIANMLGLKVSKQGKYNTTWGTKTPLGLYLSIQRIIRENGK